MAADARRPLIVDIKRHSLNDGPGIRTAVFFKGCPLRCVFCQNPETQDARAEITFSEDRCIACRSCLSACSAGALDWSLPGRVRRGKCDQCGVCADACPTGALRVIGSYYPVEALLEIVLRDLPFYRHSGGGVTLTGGECTMYPDYVESWLRLVKRNQVHVVLETAGCFEYEAFSGQILPYVDLVYFDLKLADPVLHQQQTGCSNGRILRNLEQLLNERRAAIHVRVPLVPGVTATDENLRAIARLLKEMGAEQASLVPYNPLGLGMWRKLGKRQSLLPLGFMSAAQEQLVCQTFGTLLQATAAHSD
jgi:pyruvate formate lyase activating enzyme